MPLSQQLLAVKKGKGAARKKNEEKLAAKKAEKKNEENAAPGEEEVEQVEGEEVEEGKEEEEEEEEVKAQLEDASSINFAFSGLSTINPSRMSRPNFDSIFPQTVPSLPSSDFSFGMKRPEIPAPVFPVARSSSYLETVITTRLGECKTEMVKQFTQHNESIISTFEERFARLENTVAKSRKQQIRHIKSETKRIRREMSQSAAKIDARMNRKMKSLKMAQLNFMSQIEATFEEKAQEDANAYSSLVEFMKLIHKSNKANTDQQSNNLTLIVSAFEKLGILITQQTVALAKASEEQAVFLAHASEKQMLAISNLSKLIESLTIIETPTIIDQVFTDFETNGDGLMEILFPQGYGGFAAPAPAYEETTKNIRNVENIEIAEVTKALAPVSEEDTKNIEGIIGTQGVEDIKTTVTSTDSIKSSKQEVPGIVQAGRGGTGGGFCAIM